MIKFITEKEEERTLPTFGEVECEQFFVSQDGCLCQKVSHSIYNLITDNDGSPCADQMNGHLADKIKRILPHVFKIEF